MVAGPDWRQVPSLPRAVWLRVSYLTSLRLSHPLEMERKVAVSSRVPISTELPNKIQDEGQLNLNFRSTTNFYFYISNSQVTDFYS